MKNSPIKIVLTGGPCAGKTSALAKVEEELIEKGYRVFIVSESATELIKGGIRPFGNKPIDLIDFQDLLLKYQYAKEKIYDKSIETLSNTSKCIIIYDRGLLDNKAYIDKTKFNQLLEKNNLNELEIMDSYDMVIHMVTAADGAEKFYTLSNNNARTETVQQAIVMDSKTVNAWAGHSNLKIISNESNFDAKLQNVIDEIGNLLGEPVSLRRQRKYLVDLANSNLSFLNKDNSTKIHIEQTYIEDNESFETRLRKRSYSNQDSYYLTVQAKENNGKSTVLTNRKISKEEYNQLLLGKQTSSLIKNRYSFTQNKQYFRLDIIDGIEDFALLEIEPTSINKNITLPPELDVIEDVTNNINYSNYSITKLNKLKEKKTLVK